MQDEVTTQDQSPEVSSQASGMLVAVLFVGAILIGGVGITLTALAVHEQNQQPTPTPQVSISPSPSAISSPTATPSASPSGIPSPTATPSAQHEGYTVFAHPTFGYSLEYPQEWSLSVNEDDGELSIISPNVAWDEESGLWLEEGARFVVRVADTDKQTVDDLYDSEVGGQTTVTIRSYTSVDTEEAIRYDFQAQWLIGTNTMFVNNGRKYSITYYYPYKRSGSNHTRPNTRRFWTHSLYPNKPKRTKKPFSRSDSPSRTYPW